MTTDDKTVFVFGSNLAGRHGSGSAKEALLNWGAVYGVGVGPMGRSYAIATKDTFLKTLSLGRIEVHVKEFLGYARRHPDCKFNVVAIGCGLAGYKPEDIAPMFANAPANVELPREFKLILENRGTER